MDEPSLDELMKNSHPFTPSGRYNQVRALKYMIENYQHLPQCEIDALHNAASTTNRCCYRMKRVLVGGAAIVALTVTATAWSGKDIVTLVKDTIDPANAKEVPALYNEFKNYDNVFPGDRLMP